MSYSPWGHKELDMAEGLSFLRAFQVVQWVKNPPMNTGDDGALGPIPGLRRSPGEGNGHPLQYSCLENSIDRGAWWAMVHGIAKS